MIEIQIFPMRNTDDGATLAIRPHKPDFLDVIANEPGENPIEECEDLATYDEACEVANAMRARHPGAEITDAFSSPFDTMESTK